MALTLYHAPLSRSTGVISLLHELDIMDDVEIIHVPIMRQDGAPAKDSPNPHPEGKVPLLDHDGAIIWERAAIMTYLCDLYPEAGMAPMMGDPKRGPFLSWMAYYHAVVEPVIHFRLLDIKNPQLFNTFRGYAEMTDRYERGLAGKPYLLGDRYSAADLLLASPFIWFADFMPDSKVIRDWVDRCKSRPAGAKAYEFDQKLMASAA
jgi:glutathione S-transferase